MNRITNLRKKRQHPEALSLNAEAFLDVARPAACGSGRIVSQGFLIHGIVDRPVHHITLWGAPDPRGGRSVSKALSRVVVRKRARPYITRECETIGDRAPAFYPKTFIYRKFARCTSRESGNCIQVYWRALRNVISYDSIARPELREKVMKVAFCRGSRSS